MPLTSRQTTQIGEGAAKGAFEAKKSASPLMRQIGEAPTPLPTRLSDKLRNPVEETLGTPVGRIALGISIGCLLLVGLVFAFARPTGIPAEEIVAFLEHLDNNRIEDAEKLAKEHEKALPEALVARIERALRQARHSQAATLLAEATAAFDAGLFDAALETAGRGLELFPKDPDLLFLAGEALRNLDRLDEARSYYFEFSQEAENDPRLDDSFYWQAAALLEAGQAVQARALCEHILEMEDSNFKTAAERCLEETGTEE